MDRDGEGHLPCAVPGGVKRSTRHQRERTKAAKRLALDSPRFRRSEREESVEQH